MLTRIKIYIQLLVVTIVIIIIKPQVYVHVFRSISVLQNKHNFINCSRDPAASTNRMIFTETNKKASIH